MDEKGSFEREKNSRLLTLARQVVQLEKDDSS